MDKIGGPNGCEFGRMLEQKSEMQIQELRSDYKGLILYTNCLREKELPTIKKEFWEAKQMAENAHKISLEAKAGFSKLIYAVVTAILVLILTNIVNQAITNTGINKLYNALTQKITSEVKNDQPLK